MTCLMILMIGVSLLAARAGAAAVPFANPPEFVSSGGVLDPTLTVAAAEVEVAGKRVSTTVYNGAYMPPLLRVQPGDTIRLTLDNESTQSTNVHYHGLDVTPLGTGDNVFLDIEPDTQFSYDFSIPTTHSQGLFWYHPHLHPGVNPQIAGGMSGGIIIGNILAPFPELQGLTERVMLLKDLKLRKGTPVANPDPTGKTIRTINGLFKPRIDIRPGELQFWRIGNIGANIFYKLRLPGHGFYVVAQDGNLKNQVIQTKELLIPPAARYEVLVRGARPGRYPLEALRFATGPDGDHYPAQVLATVVSEGPEVTNPIPLPTSFPVLTDLTTLPIARQRPITFADEADPTNPNNQFTIDGKWYDHNRIDTTVNLGDVEEWIIRNTSKELHVFHIHQTNFQVVSIDGVPQPFTGYQDTVSLPFAKKRNGQLVPGEVRIIIPFTNPVMLGRFVYHCHIVQHADQGMMANIEVVSGLGSAPAPSGPAHHH